MLILDDVIEDRLFIDDMKAAFPDIDMSRVFSPNAKPDIVQRLRNSGVLHTTDACACEFLRCYARVIRDLGGLQVIFCDVFGGYDLGAKRVIEIIDHFHLFAQKNSMKNETIGGLIAFAASDMNARLQRGSRISETVHVLSDLLSFLFERSGIVARPIPMEARFPIAYGTMQFYALKFHQI